jgi:hypothetical protein
MTADFADMLRLPLFLLRSAIAEMQINYSGEFKRLVPALKEMTMTTSLVLTESSAGIFETTRSSVETQWMWMIAYGDQEAGRRRMDMR